MPDFIGKQISHYRLERLLGTGGFAEVYLATHMHLNTQVAIKILHTRLRQENMKLFHKEAQAIANLKHPHIVRMLDFGVEDDQIPYLVMDYLPGGTLRQYYTQEKPLSLTQIALYTRQIAEALQYAHDARYIHRDVKPDNMLMTADAHLLLSDFSLAVIVHNTSSQSTQQIAGTPIYMAPEQIEQYPRPASDQYALGVVVYEWLCGQPPFSGTMLEIATKHCMVAPPPLRKYNPAIPPAVEQVVFRALAKDWSARFPNIREFARSLQQAAYASTVTAIPPRNITDPPPLEDELPTAIRPSYRQRSRLPIINEQTSQKRQTLWLTGYTLFMLLWWIPYLINPQISDSTSFSLYPFIVAGVIMPGGALMAGALFGWWRGGLVAAVYTIIPLILFGYNLFWGDPIRSSTTVSYFFYFASYIAAALVVGKIQQRRSRRSFGRAYLMMLLGTSIVVLGWAPGLFTDTSTKSMTAGETILTCVLFIVLGPMASCLIALPVALFETLLQHNIGSDEIIYH